jgi:hypothetical protein
VTAAARIRILRDGAERAIDVAAGAVTIGRAAGQLLRLVEDGIAAEHAVVHLGPRWEVEARGGAVDVDGEAVPSGQRCPLARGGRITLAGWLLVVDDPPAGATAAGAVRTASLARELVRALLGGDRDGGGPRLVIEAGPAAGQIVPIGPPPARIAFGRGDEADIVLLDPDLSRRHCAFDRDDDGIRVVDLGSKNGTRVGDREAPRAPPGLALGDGDVVAIGATVIRLDDPAERYLCQLDGPAPVPDETPVAAPPATPPAEAARPAADAPSPSLVPVIVAAAIAVGAVVALIWLLV